MVSVTIDNINELLPEIEANISASLFVAVDTEFSGLNLGGGARESRFDGAEERYQHYRQNVHKAALLQLGIACFIPKATGDLADDPLAEDDGKEELEDEEFVKIVCYNISLAPAHVGLKHFASKIFSAEWSALRFLKSHGFDLHKVVESGVPFMNLKEVEKLAVILANGISRLRPKDFDPDALRCAEAEIEGLEDLIDANDSPDSSFEVKDFKSSPLVLHFLLREKHPELWTSPLTSTSLKVTVVGPEERRKLENSDFSLEDWLVKQSSIAGRIFSKLVADRKIVVGFQLLQDILFIVNSFYAPLPENYAAFKNIVKDLFPNAYDGKIISNCLSRHPRINMFGHFESNALKELYQTLTSPKTMGVFHYAPPLVHDSRHAFYARESHAHEAAFDAFMSGVVVLYSVFALNADTEAEARLKAIMQPPTQPGQPERRPFRDRDGTTTLHKMPPLQLRRVPILMKVIEENRGLMHIHFSADKCVNMFGEDEQADRSKNWVRLTSLNEDVPIIKSDIVAGYLDACAYEYRIISDHEIIIACTTADRAAKVAEYAVSGFGVNAEVFDSVSLRNGKVQKMEPPIGFGTEIWIMLIIYAPMISILLIAVTIIFLEM